EFLESCDLQRMRPDNTLVTHADGCAAYAMSDSQKQFAIYLVGRGGGELRLKAPAGKYGLEWIDPRDGKTIRTDEVPSNGRIILTMPQFQGEAAVKGTVVLPTGHSLSTSNTSHSPDSR
ncbi:MAG TPA: hypothetical protein VE890_03135, partial [Thermoguttaceae bacterium]|nr:hypothetical protein [Thermoguttaceae bacterium]